MEIQAIFYLLATQDRMIPAQAQAAMAERAGATVVEVSSSHAVMLSQPDKVAALIRTAAKQNSLPDAERQLLSNINHRLREYHAQLSYAETLTDITNITDKT